MPRKCGCCSLHYGHGCTYDVRKVTGCWSRRHVRSRASVQIQLSYILTLTYSGPAFAVHIDICRGCHGELGAQQLTAVESLSTMSEATIKVGDKISEGTFTYVPYMKELETGVRVCRIQDAQY